VEVMRVGFLGLGIGTQRAAGGGGGANARIPITVFPPTVRWAQTVSPSRIGVSVSVLAPEVTVAAPGAITISPARISIPATVFSPTVSVASAGYDTDWDAYVTNHAPSSSTTFKDAGDVFVRGLKTDGIWAKLDWLLIPADTSAGSLRNVHNLSQTASAINSPTFTAYRGFTGDGSTSFVDFGQTYNAAGNLYTLNSATAGVWCNQQNGTTGPFPHIGAAGQNRTVLTASASGNETAQINVTSGSTARVGTSRLGHRAASRSLSTEFRAYFNGTLSATLTSTSTSVSSANAALLRSNTAFSSDRVAAAYTGGNLTDADHTAMHSRLSTFLTAIGAN
jgi:hypothetical protein